jgi:hypothetical protein
MTRTNGLLNTIALLLTVGAIAGLTLGLDLNVAAIIATIGCGFALAVYWRQRPPGWPRNAKW